MKKVLLVVAATLLISTVAFADIDRASLQTCKFSRAGSPCEAGLGRDCAAFKIDVTVGPHTLGLGGSYLSEVAGCMVVTDTFGDNAMLTLPTPGTWIIYVPDEGIPLVVPHILGASDLPS